MTISIIIAVKTWQKNLEDCVAKCLQLDYSNFEIIILPDNSFDDSVSGSRLSVFAENLKPNTEHRNENTVPLRIIPTGPLSPAEKRDKALECAKGEILAFIDDDAYPRGDWLKGAVLHFADENVAAVGGPAVTPCEDNQRQKISGLIYESALVSGQFTYRYQPKKMREVQDFPTCNLFVRKFALLELGGFQTKFWPGEDTKLCLDITRKLGKKIIYDPEVLVWHHRREVFLPHLRQVSSYALHRGYFVKKYPQTSLRLAYFIPSLFVLWLFAGGLISLFSGPLRIGYLLSISLYLLLVSIFCIFKDLRLIPLIFFGIILTHLAYGIYFLKGLVSKLLPEEKSQNESRNFLSAFKQPKGLSNPRPKPPISIF